MTSADLIAFAFAAIICAGGLAALVGQFLRPSPKDRLLLWVGLFATLYGVRLMLTIGPVAARFITPEQASYATTEISDVILIPAILFGEELYGPGWHGAMRWLAILAAAYAVVAIAIDLKTRRPLTAPDPALPLLAPGLLFVFVAGRAGGYQPKPFPEWRILLGGFLVFVLFVLHEHAVAAGLLPWQLRIEPVGMLVFNASLGYIAVSRFFSTTRQLAAIDKEMESARQIQSSILPRALPTADGIDLAARYEPLAAVAGDFYDVVSIGEGAVAVLVADVSGHGVPAALIASMVKVAFVAQIARSADPAVVLDGMNQTLCGMFDRAYVTAVCVRIERTAVTYAVAGHPPPILVSSDGSVTTLDERGMFIGMFPFAVYRSATVPIDGAARLILYTDGVTEAPAATDDELFGLSRLMEYARARRVCRARAFADGLIGEIEAFARRTPLPHDDLTVVVVDVGQPAG